MHVGNGAFYIFLAASIGWMMRCWLFQDGVVHNESLVSAPSSGCSVDGADTGLSASQERRRCWTVMEALGPHECIFPGCRGETTEAGICTSKHAVGYNNNKLY